MIRETPKNLVGILEDMRAEQEEDLALDRQPRELYIRRAAWAFGISAYIMHSQLDGCPELRLRVNGLLNGEVDCIADMPYRPHGDDLYACDWELVGEGIS